MRLVKLSVQRFQCIETAELELGPGLNVLYGPNDLGKSSLAWAIRAVLLLQHSSSVHERFVSWYGGGEPRVVLTLADDDERYWRVAKTFGGSAGRSLLESSKDGTTFVTEAQGRQVDDKLRELLRWGVPKPGGTGGARGLPTSFLAQVLLAEQDDVRKVLFGGSLATDGDESGRLRLTEALGALAQDPLFKRVLDDAQACVDRAFTPTGRKKKTAGSPFTDVIRQLKELQEQHADLDAKVKESGLAEAKIRELIAERDGVEHSLHEARALLAAGQRQLAARIQHEALGQQLRGFQAELQRTDELQQAIAVGGRELEQLAASNAADATAIAAAGATATAAEARLAEARGSLDALAHGDASADRTKLALEAEQQAVQARVHAAERTVERTDDALRRAGLAARALATAAEVAGQHAETARQAEQTSAAAGAEAAVAQAALDQARQRLRDLASGDRAQARQLRQQELANQRLTRGAARTALAHALERTSAVGALIDKARAAGGAHAAAAAAITTLTTAVAADQAGLAAHDGALRRLRQLEQAGALRQARDTLVTARQAVAAVEEDRGRARLLRQEVVALRASLRAGLPLDRDIEALRQHRDDLRIAEARLGSVSVVVRPRRALTLRTTRDGVADPARTIDESTPVSAHELLVIELDDLVALEVTAGAEEVRSVAADLRARWQAAGAPVLAACGVATVEQLAELRRGADGVGRTIDDKEREARLVDAQAAQRTGPSDLAALEASVTELEAALAGADLAALLTELVRLGPTWAATLRQRSTAAQREREAHVAQLDQRLGQLARAEAQLEGLAREAAALALEAGQQEAGLGGAWSSVADRERTALAAADRALAELDQQLAAVVDAGDEAETRARADVAAREPTAAAAHAARERAAAVASTARDAVVAATTTLEAARAQARDLDGEGRWSAALAATVPRLDLGPWQDAATAAVAARDDAHAGLDQVRQRLDQATRQRAETISLARAAVAAAEAAVVAARTTLDGLQTRAQRERERLTLLQIEVAERRVTLAGTDVDEARRAIPALTAQRQALEADAAAIDPAEVARRDATVARLAGLHRDTEDGLARARGALEQVGGAIVREQLRELDQAILQLRDRERGLELEFDAWKLLVETLRETESTEGQHLGRALTVPVSRRFSQLTGGRYDHLELGAHLEAGGLRAAGDVRDIAVLSAGTQDQLATLLRLCIAEQLRSAIVLDDHLSQSDPGRIAWFNGTLRTAAQQVQIIFITCRPLELLAAAELPGAGEAQRTGTAGLTRAVDLGQVIRRFAPDAPMVDAARAGTRPR